MNNKFTIIVVNNNEQLVLEELICNSRCEYFLELKKYLKIKEFYILSDELAFVELHNMSNVNTVGAEFDDYIKTEISNYHLYKKSITYAKKHHGQQIYCKGFPYFYHLKQADKVIDHFYSDIPKGKFFEIKTGTILHDIIEDTPITYDDIKRDFNSSIADMVLKVSKVKETDNIKDEKEYYKLVARNIASIYIKIADKCANSKHTLKDKSLWHANRLVHSHNVFSNLTYHKIEAPKMKLYLNGIIKKLSNLV